jgi:hypothetical protein
MKAKTYGINFLIASHLRLKMFKVCLTLISFLPCLEKYFIMHPQGLSCVNKPQQCGSKSENDVFPKKSIGRVVCEGFFKCQLA